VTSDDQKTLHISEMRLHARNPQYGLQVGRVSPEYGAAFYNVNDRGSAARQPTPRADRLRISPYLLGSVHILHTSNQSLCAIFNSGRRGRQVVMRPALQDPTDGRTAGFNYAVLWTREECSQQLAPDQRYCLGADRGASVSAHLAQSASGMPPSLVYPIQMEDYVLYAQSRRCGPACDGVLGSVLRVDTNPSVFG